MKQNYLNLKAAMLLMGMLTVFTMSSFAQDKETTVKGELLDLDCYMASGAHGNDHHLAFPGRPTKVVLWQRRHPVQ